MNSLPPEFAKPVAKPAAKSAAKSTAKSAVKAKVAIKPVVEPVAKSVAPAAAAPVAAPVAAPAPAESSPLQEFDRHLHAKLARFSFGLSPIAFGLAMADWGWHLAISPGRRMELAMEALRKSGQLGQEWAVAWLELMDKAVKEDKDGLVEEVKDGWQTGMEMMQDWWHQATQVRGVSPHHRQINEFILKQMFAAIEPLNWPLSHPEIVESTLATGGLNLLAGGNNLLADLQRQLGSGAEEVSQFRVGENIAITPGTVVYQNHLMELIQYAPQTDKVYREPVFIVPSWIMKYYILDLSQHNSLVRFLVQQGHTVFILSWHNPDESDRELGMNDYLRHGIFDALTEIGQITGHVPVHAAGYCLGGTLLAIAMAALSRPNQVAGAKQMPPVASMTLLAAQTDFSEPGEMGVLIDDSQVQLLEDLMQDTGYMTGSQMAGSFQFLNSRDLVWNKRLQEYLMGVKDAGTDMMAWNADVTRLPARMHGEYLRQFFIDNQLAKGSYLVERKPVSLLDIRVPVFAVGTVRDTVSPWRSVYKIHNLVRSNVTFLLVAGGHNAGIISEPGHAHRSFRIHTHLHDDPMLSPQDWPTGLAEQEGSWWPTWHKWLAERSGPLQAPPVMRSGLAAPGKYVFKRYS